MIKTDYKNNKGVYIVMVGDTQNTLPYKDNKELIKQLDIIINKQNLSDIGVFDFEDRTIYYINDNEELEELKKELGVK